MVRLCVGRILIKSQKIKLMQLDRNSTLDCTATFRMLTCQQCLKPMHVTWKTEGKPPTQTVALGVKVNSLQSIHAACFFVAVRLTDSNSWSWNIKQQEDGEDCADRHLNRARQPCQTFLHLQTPTALFAIYYVELMIIVWRQGNCLNHKYVCSIWASGLSHFCLQFFIS